MSFEALSLSSSTIHVHVLCCLQVVTLEDQQEMQQLLLPITQASRPLQHSYHGKGSVLRVFSKMSAIS